MDALFVGHNYVLGLTGKLSKLCFLFCSFATSIHWMRYLCYLSTLSFFSRVNFSGSQALARVPLNQFIPERMIMMFYFSPCRYYVVYFVSVVSLTVWGVCMIWYQYTGSLFRSASHVYRTCLFVCAFIRAALLPTHSIHLIPKWPPF